MGKGKPLPLDQKQDTPQFAVFVEWKSTLEAEWKLLCVTCGETFRRVISGKSQGQMWHILQSKPQKCPRCWASEQDKADSQSDRDYVGWKASGAWKRNRQSGLAAIYGNDENSAQAEIIRDGFMSDVGRLADFADFQQKLRDMLNRRLESQWWVRHFPKDKPIRQILKDAFDIAPRMRMNT